MVSLGGLQDLDHAGEPGVGHEPPKGLGTQAPLAYQLVPVAARPERRLRVVQVQDLEAPEPEHPLPVGPDAVEVANEIVAGRVEMTGVGAEAHPAALSSRNEASELGQLFECAAQRGAGPGGGLEQNPGPG